MEYGDILQRTQPKQKIAAGGISDIKLREGRLVTEVIYGFQELVSPGRDVIFSFYVPERTLKIYYLKVNVYFPGFQQGDYPLNSSTFYLPCTDRACLEYKNGAFSVILATDYEVGNSAGGGNYYWARLFTRFHLASLLGLSLTTCDLKWGLASKSVVGSGPNTQIPLRLHAINNYGELDSGDWSLSAKADYGDVNVYTDAVGAVYTANVKDRVQSLIDAGTKYAAFRYKATTEKTDTANANSYHLNEPVLYCEFEEDTTSPVILYANNGPGFGSGLLSFNTNKEELELKDNFSGVGKKQIKLSASKSRRVEVLVRMGIKIGAGG